MSRPATPAITRLLPRVAAATNGCWLWTGALDGKGYGRISDGSRVPAKAHTVAYEHFIGPVPAGLTLDHLCHTNDPECPGGVTCTHRRCVNPDHLEPVTSAENQRRMRCRQSHCSQGHAYTEANSYFDPQGCRRCRRCRADAAARLRTRVAVAA